MPVETDKSWEVAEGKQLKAATEVHPYGKGPWKRVLDNAISQDRNHSWSRSHPGGPREERLFDARWDVRTAIKWDLPTGRADHFASNRSGQWTDPPIPFQGARAEGQKNRPENGSIGSSAMPWPGSLRPRRKAFSRSWRRIPGNQEMEDLLGWSSCIPNFKSYAKHHESSRIHHPQRFHQAIGRGFRSRSCDPRTGLGQQAVKHPRPRPTPAS